MLRMDPSLLEEVEGFGEIGKDKFGTVHLKKNSLITSGSEVF